jgi:hypothetical protein
VRREWAARGPLEATARRRPLAPCLGRDASGVADRLIAIAMRDVEHCAHVAISSAGSEADGAPAGRRESTASDFVIEWLRLLGWIAPLDLVPLS